jgi:hypothetical protein
VRKANIADVWRVSHLLLVIFVQFLVKPALLWFCEALFSGLLRKISGALDSARVFILWGGHGAACCNS